MSDVQIRGRRRSRLPLQDRPAFAAAAALVAAPVVRLLRDVDRGPRSRTEVGQR